MSDWFVAQAGNRVGDMQTVVSSLLCPYEISADPQVVSPWSLQYGVLGDVGILDMWQRGAFDIDVEKLGSFWLLVLPVRGTYYSATADGYAADYRRGVAQLIHPDTPFKSYYGRHCRQWMLRWSERSMENLSILLQREIGNSLFPQKRSLGSVPGAALMRFLGFMLGECGRHSPLTSIPIVSRHLEHAVLALIADYLEQDSLAENMPPPISGTPYYVRRAEDYIMAHLDQNIGIVDIVRHAGVSKRTLYRGFMACRGITPGAFMRLERLRQAHAELSGADPAVTRVIDVAHRWGFYHLSQFSAYFRHQFGCLPSDVLRRRLS